MKQIALIMLLFTLSTIVAIAKEKPIKFHKPETEAERALDYILRMTNRMFHIGLFFPDKHEEYLQYEALLKAHPGKCITQYHYDLEDDDKAFCRHMFTDQFMYANHIKIEECIADYVKRDYTKYPKSVCQANNGAFNVFKDNSIHFYTIHSTNNKSCIHYMTSATNENIKKMHKESKDTTYANSSDKFHYMVKMIKEDNYWKIDAYYHWFDFSLKVENKTKENPLGTTLRGEYDWYDKYDYYKAIIPSGYPNKLNKETIVDFCQ